MASDAYIHKHLPGEPGGALLFAFHGTGGDERQLLEMAHGLMPSATVISPRGDVSEHGSARFFRRTAEGVYDMDDLARASAKMAGFVSAHIEAAKPSAVFGIGYSNGANILASTMFEAPGLFDAAVIRIRRRQARSDLPAQPDGAPRILATHPRRRCHRRLA